MKMFVFTALLTIASHFFIYMAGYYGGRKDQLIEEIKRREECYENQAS